VGFLDDDNWPRPNWVTEVVKFGQSHPRVGAYGGRIYGVFESPPEDAVKPLLRFLAVRDRGPEPKPFQPADLQFPPGAGLVVRRAAWLACVPPTLVRTARAGDDYEISVRLAKHGWLIWYNPTMEIDHFIPAARLRREYLKPLIHLYGLCTCELLMIETPWWRRPFLLFKSFIGSLHRIGWHYIKYGWHSQHTLQADCELSFHVGNLKSPWIYLLNKFL
jgi:GT2 family glycosyltransferase